MLVWCVFEQHVLQELYSCFTTREDVAPMRRMYLLRLVQKHRERTRARLIAAREGDDRITTHVVSVMGLDKCQPNFIGSLS